MGARKRSSLAIGHVGGVEAAPKSCFHSGPSSDRRRTDVGQGGLIHNPLIPSRFGHLGQLGHLRPLYGTLAHGPDVQFQPRFGSVITSPSRPAIAASIRPATLSARARWGSTSRST